MLSHGYGNWEFLQSSLYKLQLKKATGVIQSESTNLKTRITNGLNPIHRLEKDEIKCPNSTRQAGSQKKQSSPCITFCSIRAHSGSHHGHSHWEKAFCFNECPCSNDSLIWNTSHRDIYIKYLIWVPCGQSSWHTTFTIILIDYCNTMA